MREHFFAHDGYGLFYRIGKRAAANILEFDLNIKASRLIKNAVRQVFNESDHFIACINGKAAVHLYFVSKKISDLLTISDLIGKALVFGLPGQIVGYRIRFLDIVRGTDHVFKLLELF